ncbi:MAG: hypothetical protein JKY55_18400 [Aliivibrio sp.]|uniref:hypothetical protein n=1 Tax=Aliivibrio sp. TaxID=1872443 RepID=UPI001A3925BE|nr:hypothetical protein [Aliivibrio sp.]
MNTTLPKVFCTLVLLSCALTSAYLTYLFMFDLGAAIGIAAIFALIGITLDLVKTISPTFVPAVAKKSLFTALLLAGLTGVLMAISIIASISAIEKGADNMTVSTRQSAAITEQIKSKQLELGNLQLLSQKQISTNYTSKAAETARSLSKATGELNALYQAQSTTKSTSLLSQYDSSITLIIAISIEVVSVVMALTLHALNTPAVSVQSVSMPDCAVGETSSDLADIKDTLPSARAAILSGAVKPNYRSLRRAFGVSQEQGKRILSVLYEQDVLESRGGSGYKLRAA